VDPDYDQFATRNRSQTANHANDGIRIVPSLLDAIGPVGARQPPFFEGGRDYSSLSLLSRGTHVPLGGGLLTWLEVSWTNSPPSEIGRIRLCTNPYTLEKSLRLISRITEIAFPFESILVAFGK